MTNTPVAQKQKELMLDELTGEALRNNPGLRAFQHKVEASRFRIPQEKGLPDPMFMAGYQNEGWNRFTLGEMEGAQLMFSASQTFPYPGKLGLKGEIAAQDSKSLEQACEGLKLQTVRKVKDLYYGLLLDYKELDIIASRRALFDRMEDAALARYSAGLAPQEDVLLAQTEKYRLLERQQQINQKIQSGDAALNAALGRDVATPLGRPMETAFELKTENAGDLTGVPLESSPAIKAKKRLVEAADANLRLAKKQYYPDFTVTGSVAKRGGEFEDMWALTGAVNVPLYYRTKQRQGVYEAQSLRSDAEREVDAARYELASDIKGYYVAAKTADKLMELYRKGLIPKTYQDFEAALAGYSTGKVTALTAIDRLKSLLDLEFLYWEQFAAKQKAIAAIEAITGKTPYITEAQAR